MNQTPGADESLAQAQRLDHATRRASRWLARYYVIFGAASMALAVGFGLFHSATASIILSVTWALLITGLSIYAARQPVMMRGAGRLHGAVMAAWTLAWAVTVIVGRTYALAWPWWVGGGVAMLAIALAGAAVVRRRVESAA